jgi:hypothetical protein
MGFVQVVKASVLTIALTFWAGGTIVALIGKFCYNIDRSTWISIMRAIKATGSINEGEQIHLDRPYVDSMSKEEILCDFRQAWHEAMTGQTVPVSQIWNGLIPDMEVADLSEINDNKRVELS